MSHNVTMSGIPLKDMDALRKALNELNREYGTQFKLEIGAIPTRNYSLDQTRRETRLVPGTFAVIKTGDRFEHDLSLVKKKDGSIALEGEALLITPLLQAFKIQKAHDLTKNEDVSLVGVGYRSSEELGFRAALGPIVQRYSVLIAEKQAALKGHKCRREVDAKTGVITLVATVPA